MDVGLENVQDIKSMPNLVKEPNFKSQSQRYFVLKSAPSYFVLESAARYFVLKSTGAALQFLNFKLIALFQKISNFSKLFKRYI
jgi:hypothetical protein